MTRSHGCKAILDVGGHDGHAETVTLDPPAAARRILDQLDEWGYDTPVPTLSHAPR